MTEISIFINIKRTYAQAICLNTNQFIVLGSAGGPGTVYFRKSNYSTMVVNNFGKRAHIKTDVRCEESDILSQGDVLLSCHCRCT